MLPDRHFEEQLDPCSIREFEREHEQAARWLYDTLMLLDRATAIALLAETLSDVTLQAVDVALQRGRN